MQTTTFTSTISPALISWLDAQAKREKRTRRHVLEEAITAFKRTTMREGFARAAKDKDVIEMAEWGMDEYSRMASDV
jgi:predicted transcriptional regulator